MNQTRILIVDDSDTTLYLVRSFLQESIDCQVFLEHNSKRALNTIARLHPDILILDLLMPHKTGLEILYSIRSKSINKDLPVVILSSASSNYYIREANRLHATYYLTKPIRKETLVNAILNIQVTLSNSKTYI
ncbi:MAG: response regulator [Bacteroidales bacterium]|nr:response regulator [Bacteroidales bacterium]